MHWRYQERLVEQALVQKLARMISGLRAVDVLYEAGLYQEQCCMQRILDDITDDITFLSLGVASTLDPIHERYLEEFWKEEFDRRGPLSPPASRGMVKRNKIHAYITRALSAADPHTHNQVARIIQKTYSGYLHAASPHVMDMCGGNPPRFHLGTMKGTPLTDVCQRDAWNYYFRGLLATFAVASAMGRTDTAKEITSFVTDFESTSQANVAQALGIDAPR